MPLFTILSWYVTEDFVKNINKSLDMLLLVERFLPCTLLWLLGVGPRRKSIPMLFEWNTVGNEKACELVVIEMLKFEEENSLFAKFLIGATMQDSGKRKEAMTTVFPRTPCNKLLI